MLSKHRLASYQSKTIDSDGIFSFYSQPDLYPDLSRNFWSRYSLRSLDLTDFEGQSSSVATLSLSLTMNLRHNHKSNGNLTEVTDEENRQYTEYDESRREV
jgi:hypothetical protein